MFIPAAGGCVTVPLRVRGGGIPPMKTNDRLGVLHSGNTLLPRPNKVLPSYLGNLDFSFKFSVTVRGSYQIKIYANLYIRATPPSKQKSRDFLPQKSFTR